MMLCDGRPQGDKYRQPEHGGGLRRQRSGSRKDSVQGMAPVRTGRGEISKDG